jgi:hypothetical protein
VLLFSFTRSVLSDLGPLLDRHLLSARRGPFRASTATALFSPSLYFPLPCRSFSYDEGEGKGTRNCWLAVHRDFFTRQAAREGFAMHDQMSTVFERFKVVWPPEVADRD